MLRQFRLKIVLLVVVVLSMTAFVQLASAQGDPLSISPDDFYTFCRQFWADAGTDSQSQALNGTENTRRNFDEWEDRWDRREDVRDRHEDWLDRYEDFRDRVEDRLDDTLDREDCFDRREDRRDEREDRRDARKTVGTDAKTAGIAGKTVGTDAMRITINNLHVSPMFEPHQPDGAFLFIGL